MVGDAMQKNDVSIGKKCQCQSVLLGDVFVGDIVALYENTCIVELKKCAPQDTSKALEFNNRFVVRFEDMVAT